MHTCIPAYLNTFIHAYLHTSILAYLHTFILSYLHTCIPGVPKKMIHKKYFFFKNSPSRNWTKLYGKNAYMIEVLVEEGSNPFWIPRKEIEPTGQWKISLPGRLYFLPETFWSQMAFGNLIGIYEMHLEHQSELDIFHLVQNYCLTGRPLPGRQ